MENAEGDSASVSGDAEHLTDDRAGHVLFEDHGVAVEEPVQGLLTLGAEVGGEEAVEVASRFSAGRERTLRKTLDHLDDLFTVVALDAAEVD